MEKKRKRGTNLACKKFSFLYTGGFGALRFACAGRDSGRWRSAYEKFNSQFAETSFRFVETF
jgi:hypothetical protein